MDIISKKIKPICPHCEEKLDNIILVNHGFFSAKVVYCCPECHKIVGVGVSS